MHLSPGNVDLQEFADFREGHKKNQKKNKKILPLTEFMCILLLCLKAVILFLKINYN